MRLGKKLLAAIFKVIIALASNTSSFFNQVLFASDKLPLSNQSLYLKTLKGIKLDIFAAKRH